MDITIIGSGKMGRALSTRFLESGHSVTLVGHTPGKAEALVEELKSHSKGGTISVADPNTLLGEVVIFALPYSVVQSVTSQYIEQLSGKILVDITNPVDLQKMELTAASGSSAAEEIARIAPVSTKVVKAF
jgi:8-hydroxy-5-deazaflavin:NADPH oxidoreductase